MRNILYLFSTLLIVAAPETMQGQELYRLHFISGLDGYSRPFSYGTLQGNDLGQVVGSFNSQARVWEAGQTTDLGFFGAGIFSEGIMANDSGSYLGNVTDYFGNRFAAVRTGNGPWQVSRWPSGGYQVVRGASMNNNDQFVGTASFTLSGQGRAFFHPGADGNTTPTILGNPGGYVFSSAHVISNSGLIGGNAYNDPNVPIAVVWDTNGNGQVLGQTGIPSSVSGLSDNNIAVGFDGDDAVAWVNGGRIRLLPGTDGNKAVANAISNRFDLIVGNTNRSNTFSESIGFLWIQGTAYDLSSLDDSEAVIYRADDINGNLQIFGQSDFGPFIANPVQNRTRSGSWDDRDGWRWGLLPNEKSTVKLVNNSDTLLVTDGTQSQMEVADLEVGQDESLINLRSALVIENGQDLNVTRSFWGNGLIRIQETGALIADGDVNATVMQVDGVLSGSGLVFALATEVSGAHLIGNSPGIQNFGGDLRYLNGAVLEWELTENSSVGRGSVFDGVNLLDPTRSLTVEDGVSIELVFNSSGSSVSWDDEFWRTNQEWLVFDGFQNLTNDNPDIFDIRISADSSGSQLVTAEQFSWRRDGQSLYLTFEASNEIERFVGTINDLTHEYQTIFFPRPMVDPVVVTSLPTTNGIHPGNVRLRNVTSVSFDIAFEEWGYLNFLHGEEAVSYLVIESGTHSLPNGGTLVAGAKMVNHQFQTESFIEAFAQTPIVLCQVASMNGSDPCNTRIDNVDEFGFDVRLQEEEAGNQRHAFEEVFYIAVEPGVSESAAFKFEAGLTNAILSHELETFSFSQSYIQAPLVFGAAQSFNGQDPITPRTLHSGNLSFDVYLQEDMSLDLETAHNASEVFGFFVLSID